jgi:flavin-dependent dehydrogenase
LFDIAILGGGPAATAAALSMKQVDAGLRVLLVEAAAYCTARTRETLAPGGQALQTGLGCWERFRAEAFLESHGTAASWGSDRIHHNEFLLSARGSGWHLDRRRFDAMLADCASDARVRVQRRGPFVAATRDAGLWRVQIGSDQGPISIGARFVIDATGRTARFAVGQGAQLYRQDRLVGASVTYRDTDAWWAHLRRSGPTRARVQSGTMERPPQLSAAGTQHLVTPQGDAWVAAGDAACAWDPLSSAGILKALRTGRLAAFVALDAMLGRPDKTQRYTRIVRREHAAYLEQRTRFYSLEGRWRDATFWRRRAVPAMANDTTKTS